MGISFSNQNVLLTGATRGLGRVIAEKLAKQGANLFLVARTEKDLLQLKNDLQNQLSSNLQMTLLPIDLSQQNAAQIIFDKISSSVSSIDILINNAAIQGPIGKSWDIAWEAWEETFQINFFTPVQLMRSFIPGMIKNNKGKIINISGGGATSPRPNFSCYGATKGSLVNFSETLAKEVKQYHIDINCIAPGVMNTALLAEVLKAGETVSGATEFKIASEYSVKPDTTYKAADLCLYLASEASNGITGKLISAVWDRWEDFSQQKEKLVNSDLYTMRRVVMDQL